MSGRELPPAALRGVVAAMAMTGMRVVTVGLGWVRRPPPDQVAREGFPRLLGRVPSQYRHVAIELAHWGYGATGGAAYGLLPLALRRSRWAGPAYGIATWALFEAGIAPALGLADAEDRRLSERAAVAADHLLYGAIVGGGRPE